MTEDVATSLANAQNLVDAGRHADARAEVGRYLAGVPDSVEGLCLLALCERALDEPEHAARAAHDAVRVAPDSDVALRLHALAQMDLHRHDVARSAAEAAVGADPSDYLNHCAQAQVLLAGGHDARRARGAALRAVDLAPHEADAHAMAALAADAIGNTSSARAAYEHALRLDPEHTMALNNLAALDINRRRLGKGARKLVSGLRHDPTEAVLRQNLDNVGVLLLQRLLNAMLLTGFVLLLTVAVTDGRWVPRAVIGTLMLCGYALIAWLTLRHVPSGARRHLRSLPRRMTTRQRMLAIALVVFTLAILGAAFAPVGFAYIGGAVMIIVVRIFQVILVITVLGWIFRRVFRRNR